MYLDVSSECQLGWQHYEKTCYWFSTTALPWHSAAVCSKFDYKMRQKCKNADNNVLNLTR